MTERQYVEILAQHLRAATSAAVTVRAYGVGKDPRTVLDKALNLLAAAERDGEPYDWSVLLVDVDSHVTLQDCCRAGRAQGVGVAVSSPCFEIWLLWHYQDHAGNVDARAVGKLLERHGHTGKSLPARFPISTYTAAVARAVSADHEFAWSRIGPNPSSAVPLLVERMTGTSTPANTSPPS